MYISVKYHLQPLSVLFHENNENLTLLISTEQSSANRLKHHCTYRKVIPLFQRLKMFKNFKLRSRFPFLSLLKSIQQKLFKSLS